MSDPMPAEPIEPDRRRGADDGRGAVRRPPPTRVGGAIARERQDDLAREQPEQDPAAHAPQPGGDAHRTR